MNKSILIPGLMSLIGVGMISENESIPKIGNDKTLTVIDSTYIEKINNIGGEWIKDTSVLKVDDINLTKKDKNDINLIKALIQVESSGKEDCVGDRHLIFPSIGVLQIRQKSTL